MGRDTVERDAGASAPEAGTLNEADLDRAVNSILRRLRPRLGEIVERMVQRILARSHEQRASEPGTPGSQDRSSTTQPVAANPASFGPLATMMSDPTVSDVFVNGCGAVYVERRGRLEKTHRGFRDQAHLVATVEAIVRMTGRDVGRHQRLIDARLPDGSRLNVVWPPNAVDGPLVSIRRHAGTPLTDLDLVKRGAIAPDMLAFLRGCIKARLNMVIAGGAGSGKTTMLNVLSSYIPPTERIVTIEDAAELRLQQPHVVRLETSEEADGMGVRITARDLVRNALRMRPDRIIIGECRGAEALDMLVAMNTGHEGSITTLHANSPRDAVSRIETLVGLAGGELPTLTVRRQIAAAITLILQTARSSTGARGVTAISEITGMEGDVVSMQEIFLFDETGLDHRDRPVGSFVATGIRPRCAAKLEAAGLQLPREMFVRRTLEL